MANKHEEPLLKENSEYPGGITWVDREYDPRFKVKERFTRTKAVALWFRDKVLAFVIISILSLIAGFYIDKLLKSPQPQIPATTTQPTAPHQGSGS